MSQHLITLMVLLPLVGALAQAFLPDAKAGRWSALAASLASSICAVVLVASMQTASPELQSTETLPWVGSYAITYAMGVDGLNALLVLLVAVVFPVLIASEWRQKIGARGMHALFLVLQTAFFGTVCAQDAFLMFFFWALSALPFYFLIGIWGGEGRESAAFRTVVSAAAGNALVFGALVLVYYAVDPHTFSLAELAGGKLSGKNFELLGLDLPVPATAFAMIALGLALRTPVWPLHGWFRQAAQEAPASVFVALAAVGIPAATYVFIRLCYSLFPETMLATATAVVVIGALNLAVGAICAAAQTELRPLLAFVCLSETGLVLIGIGSLSAAGVVGAVYEQLVLGLGLAGFGLFMGLVSERVGHARFAGEPGSGRLPGGAALRAPAVAVVAGVVIASLLGFPGFGGFVGHALLIIGSFSAHPGTVVVTGAALLLATYYLFTMYRCVFLGGGGSGGGESSEPFHDLTIRERAYLLPLVAGILFCGLYPKPLLELVRPTVLTLLSTIK
jgi:NADH-quinone oxidoreductase subunit M